MCKNLEVKEGRGLVFGRIRYNKITIKILSGMYQRGREFEHADIPKSKAEAVVMRGDGRLNIQVHKCICSRWNLTKGTTLQKLGCHLGAVYLWLP